MNFSSFLKEIIPLSENDFINYISVNRNGIKKLFLKEWDSETNKNIIEKILLSLATRSFTSAQLNGIELQSLYVHLAYYFKRIKLYPYLSTCYTNIKTPYFQLRLRAFTNYHKYHNFEEHISNFPLYLDLLSKAQDEVDDGNFNEILNDLSEYVDYVNGKLSPEYVIRFNDLLNSQDLRAEYNILDLFQEKNATIVPGLEVKKYNGKEYEPSDFALDLFEDKFLSVIRSKSYPHFPNHLLGYPSKDVINDIIGRGQTDFDSKYKNLEAIDRVNLYCYFNMRMHFFSSLSIFERSNIAENYYNTSGKIKFIDIGCGPATSGIAFSDYLFQVSGEQVIFDYIGIDISNNMLSKAQDMLDNTVFDSSNKRELLNSVNDVADSHFENASCIIINCCYVFASSSLNYVEIADFVNKLKELFPYIPKYLMFQNPIQENFNKNYSKFKELIQYETEWSGYEDILYYNEQNSFYNAKTKTVYYEILRIS